MSIQTEMHFLRTMKPSYQMHVSTWNDNLVLRDEALQSLLKSELKECWHCHGVGWHTYKLTPKKPPVECVFCEGGGVVCAWCSDSKHLCKCGSDQ